MLEGPELEAVVRSVLLAVASEARASKAKRGFVKLNRVLLRLLDSENQSVPDIRKSIETECGRWTTDGLEWYWAIVSQLRVSPLLECQGNWGDQCLPPAHPRVIECRLTEAGFRKLGLLRQRQHRA